MSTRCTIRWSASWSLQEEMISEAVELVLSVPLGAQFVVSPDFVRVSLPADVLDAIAAAHVAKEFPHQRKEAKP